MNGEPSAATDRGLQAERTVLAWWRTSLAATVAGLLVVRQAFQESAHPVVHVLSGASLFVLLAIVVRRITTLQRRAGDPVPADRGAVAVFVAGVLTLQVLAVALVLA